MWSLRGAALLCLLVGACPKNEYQMRKEFQTQQAERLRPAELEHDGGGWHALRTLRAREFVDADALHKVRTAAGELARAYPDSFPVQQKACQLGMQMGLSRRELKPYCDRMMQLSLQPAAH